MDEPKKKFMGKDAFIVYLRNLGFFETSKGLTALIAESVDLQRSNRVADEPEEGVAFGAEAYFESLGITIEDIVVKVKTDKRLLRRYISEQLYMGLARIARKNKDAPNTVYDIKEFVENRLKVSLKSSLSEELLECVAEEFTTWIKNKKTLLVMWGVIKYIKGNKFTLTLL